MFTFLKGVCNRSFSRLHRPVYAHFSEVQLSHGRDPSPADIKVLEESHALLLSIYRHCPDLLFNVIALLEENLRAADEVPLRQLSTKTLGTMFGERPLVNGNVTDLARSQPSAWRSWCGRRVDMNLGVRLAWVAATGKIMAVQPDLRTQVESDLMDRIQDSDERVRAAICHVVGALDYEAVLRSTSLPLLKAVGERMSDKKVGVVVLSNTRPVSALKLSVRFRVFGTWHIQQCTLTEGELTAVRPTMKMLSRRLAGFPARCSTQPSARTYPSSSSKCMDFLTDPSSQINSAFKNTILPLPAKADDEQAWVDRFFLVASGLDKSTLLVLDNLTALPGYADGRSPYRAFADMCGGGKDASGPLDWLVTHMALTLFADAEKAKKDLEAFAKLNEPRLYKLFKDLVDPKSDLRTIIKSKVGDEGRG